MFIGDLISGIGYPGIFLCMVIEGIITPIPSEIIMPFAGFLASQGRFDIFLVILIGTTGATIGSTGAYYIGYSLGRPFLLRHGRIFRLRGEHLRKAELWFGKYGDISIFIGHSIPGTRSFISFPAGIGKMRLRNFIFFTFCGATVWNSVLTIAGFYLGERWVDLTLTFEYLDVLVIIAVIILIIGYFYWKRRRKEGQEA